MSCLFTVWCSIGKTSRVDEELRWIYYSQRERDEFPLVVNEGFPLDLFCVFGSGAVVV